MYVDCLRANNYGIACFNVAIQIYALTVFLHAAFEICFLQTVSMLIWNGFLTCIRERLKMIWKTGLVFYVRQRLLCLNMLHNKIEGECYQRNI